MGLEFAAALLELLVVCWLEVTLGLCSRLCERVLKVGEEVGEDLAHATVFRGWAGMSVVLGLAGTTVVLALALSSVTSPVKGTWSAALAQVLAAHAGVAQDPLAQVEPMAAMLDGPRQSERDVRNVDRSHDIVRIVAGVPASQRGNLLQRCLVGLARSEGCRKSAIARLPGGLTPRRVIPCLAGTWTHMPPIRLQRGSKFASHHGPHGVDPPFPIRAVSFTDCRLAST
jgi:DNA-directed RNA polymerase specialized sigma24 family protein